MRPTAMRAAAIRVSQTSDATETSTPGSLGRWAKGERSSTRSLNFSGLPNSSISTHAARTAQPTDAANRGSTPNRAAEIPASTQTAGSWAAAAASTRPSSRPTSPVLSPYARPAAMPAAPSKITGPRMAKVRRLAAHRHRETGQASTGSTRPLVSSPRSLRGPDRVARGNEPEQTHDRGEVRVCDARRAAQPLDHDLELGVLLDHFY